MEAGTAKKLWDIWQQREIPVVFRREKGRLLISLPDDPDNRSWLRAGRRNRPNWNPEYQCWETPKAWLDDLARRTLARHRRLYMIQPYREWVRCAPNCLTATRWKCVCSCMGEFHGMGSAAGQWRTVSDAFATSWREQAVACRLVEGRA